MLRFLAPGYVVAALSASAALVAAHFIVRRQPRAMVLPTARFVPDAPVLTTGWARIPTDIAVLALRVLCLLLAGLALAGPFFGGKAGGIARVVLVDRSRAVGDSVELRDSVESARAPGDVLISYGSSAFEEREEGIGLSRADMLRAERGSLSAGLVAAKRAASRFRGRADSVELLVVSSFASEQLDAATRRVREEWPGRARLVRVAATPGTEPSRAPALATSGDDPLAAALGASRMISPADVRIARGDITASDSAWAREQPGRVLVHWPILATPAGFVARAQSESAAGLATRSHAMVAPFQRGWQHAPALGSRAVAWWIDG
ncbi:MAG TPA: BatA domain-containing protein, partial [Gemmatimonadaceae bacterium]|nr:BatA domain-containing protein [Gemmatimonadaceae bacterium]